MRLPLAVRLCWLVVLIGVLAVGGGRSALASPAATAITPEQFWQQVDQTLAALRELKGQPEATILSKLDALAEDWAALDALTLPDGKTMPLDTSFLVTELRRRPQDLDALLDIFTALSGAQGLEPGQTFSEREISLIQTILQRPEFQWEKPPSPFEELWQRFWLQVNEWWNKLTGGRALEVSLPGNVMTVVASIVLVLVLLYIFRQLFGDLLVEASLKDEQATSDEKLTADTALQKAREISKAGDYRTAVRYLYLSSLLLLDERGLLRYDRSKTNREYLRSISGFPQLLGPLRDVIDVFDRVWYGFRPLDQDDFQHYADKVDELREQKK